MKAFLYQVIKSPNNVGIRYCIIFIIFLNIAAFIIYFLEYGEGSPFHHYIDALWFSIVTVTTVGYGDILPNSILGKIYSILIMFVGIAFFGITTGSITSWFVEKNRRKSLGLIPLKNLKNHFVICGWDENMPELLINILRFNENLAPEELVLVTDVNYKLIEEVRRYPNLNQIKYVSGDFTNPDILSQACIQTASNAMIVCNNYLDHKRNEIDTQTIIAIAAIKKRNPRIYCSAEIMNPYFEQYLRHLKVEEIIRSEVFGGLMIARTAFFQGTIHLFNTLFHLDYGSFKLQLIPENLIGKPYSKLFEWTQTINALCIGVIENTGSIYQRKREKLSEAQKETSIQNSITKLSEIKSLQSNIPIFHPTPEYTIKKYSRVMLLHSNMKALSEKEIQRRKKSSLLPCIQSKTEGHLLICGWNLYLKEMLQFILLSKNQFNPPWEEIYILAKFPNNELEELKKEFKTEKIKWFQGDPVIKKNLVQANIQKAIKIIILAESNVTSEKKDIDAKTVIAAMTIKSLNRSAYTIAEVKESRYLNYLRKSNVEEIIPQDHLKQTLLAKCSDRSGSSNVVRRIFQLQENLIEILPLENCFSSQKFIDVKHQVYQAGYLLIGMLEYSGTHFLFKKDAIHKAQMSPNIMDAIEQLKSSHQIMNNQIVFFPSDDYICSQNSYIIQIRSTHYEKWQHNKSNSLITKHQI